MKQLNFLLTAACCATIGHMIPAYSMNLTKQLAAANRAHEALIKEDLYVAVEIGTPHDIKARLAAGDDVNEKNHNGNTPLHAAGFNRSFDVAEILIKAGADIDATNYSGKTPLQIAYEQLQNSLKLQRGIVNSFLNCVFGPLPIERQKAMVDYLAYCKQRKDNAPKQAAEPELITRRKSVKPENLEQYY